MSLFESKPAIIDDCETQICWNGIEAITSNGGIDDLYLFRDALKAVDASTKLEVIQRAVAIYESVHQRKPTQDEAFDIGDEHGSDLTDLDSEFYKIDEDLQALCLEYVKSHPEEIEPLKKDAINSEVASGILSKVGS